MRTISTVLFILVWFEISNIACGQALVLPSPAMTVQGEGACSEATLTVSSERWRVKKGEIFQLSAFHPFSDGNGFEYHWEVANGKIIDGQGTAEIRVKAGSQKMQGYINASGFVTARVTATRQIGSETCSLAANETVMIGRFREYNGYPNIDKLTINKAELIAECDNTTSNDKSLFIADVDVVASDPETMFCTMFIKSRPVLLSAREPMLNGICLAFVQEGTYCLLAPMMDTALEILNRRK